jgi:3'(2'), 5'-bisphosphate nucleotidase
VRSALYICKLDKYRRQVVGDYSAQAVINTILSRAFPDDPIVGEEDSKDLRGDAGIQLRSRIVELANEALSADIALGDSSEWGIGPGESRTVDELLDAIDRGNNAGGPTGRKYNLFLYSFFDLSW